MARGKAADLNKFSQLRQSKPLYEQLADLIRQKITDGELSPGERLPAEIELAASLGVGRPSLREALKILQALGVLSIRHGAGVFVSPTTPDEIARRLTPSPTLPPAQLLDLFQVRKTLECQGAAWAAQRAGEADVAALRQDVAAMTVLLEEAGHQQDAPVERLAQLDRQFHRRLAHSGGNSALIGLLDVLEGMIGETMIYSLGIPGGPMQSVYDHRRVYQAVAAHKPFAAARHMFSHIDGVQRRVFALSGQAAEGGTIGLARGGASDVVEKVLVVTYHEEGPLARC